MSAPSSSVRYIEDEYDKDDDFVDDSELLWEEQAAASRDGFFVYSGPLIPEVEKPPAGYVHVPSVVLAHRQLTNITIAKHLPDVAVVADDEAVVAAAEARGVKVPAVDAAAVLGLVVVQSVGSPVSPSLRRSSATRRKPSARRWRRRYRSRGRAPALTACCRLDRVQLRASLSDRLCCLYSCAHGVQQPLLFCQHTNRIYDVSETGWLEESVSFTVFHIDTSSRRALPLSTLEAMVALSWSSEMCFTAHGQVSGCFG